MTERARIGVSPPGALQTRRCLLSALELAYAISFEVFRESVAYDGLLAFEPDARMNPLIDAGIPAYQIRPAGIVGSISARITFASHTVDSRLRGRILLEHPHYEGSDEVAVLSQDLCGEVLASIDGSPIWIRDCSGRKRCDVVSMAPEELRPTTMLRQHLFDYRFVRLLPLIDFLRRLIAHRVLEPPPLCACFVLDDPNLRRAEYGFIDFRRLAAAAANQNYHASIAIIPLDAGRTRAKGVAPFKEFSNRLSISMHGNDHTSGELGYPRPQAECLVVLSNALSRIARMESRHGIQVDRVMSPPHGQCDPSFIKAAASLGFQGLLIHPGHDLNLKDVLSGWEPVRLYDGLPVIPRTLLCDDRQDYVLRAWLNQPIVMYGHHDSCADDATLLEQRANEINSLGNVQWMSLGDIARSRYESRHEGDSMQVRLWARDVRIQVPAGVRTLSVERALPFTTAEELEIKPLDPRHCGDGFKKLSAREEIKVNPGVWFIRVRSQTVPPSLLPVQQRRRIWPVFRRAVTESRDRMQPIIRRYLR